MRLKRFGALVLAGAMAVSALSGCGKKDDGRGEDGILDLDMFIAMYGSEINDDNKIKQVIAEKTGVRVKETWLTGQTAAEAVGTIVAGGDYPDLIDGGDGMSALYDAGALVAWDEYLDKYPLLKEMYTDEEWDKFRQADGKIYWANVFQNTFGEPKSTTHNDQAFWIQVRVLEWAGYPEVNTLDQYFKLLDDYAKANPTMEDGTEIIPYTTLCEDWRYFCIENAGQFLDGYPNDGSVIVDPDTLKVVDYNTTETTKRYLKKLNEEYAKGNVDLEFATQTYDEYTAKLSTGRVLGMCDQWWNFAYTINDVLKQQGLDEKGCNYVPLGLTIEEGMTNQWHAYGDTLNNSSGVAITTSCKDIDAAFKFLNDCLSQEIHDLRYWGIEGEDYMVAEDGTYYRTKEQRNLWSDPEYKASHICNYSYLPQYLGTSRDGKNAMQPAEQPSEFFESLAQPVIDCFNAYGVTTYVEMVGSVNVPTSDWYPMYTHSNAMTTETPGGVAWVKMGEVKHEWLPKVVMAGNFESAWNDYMKAYKATKPEDFLAEMQTELERRIEAANK